MPQAANTTKADDDTDPATTTSQGTPQEGQDDDNGEGDDEGTLDARAQAALRKVRSEARNLRQRLKDLEPLAQRAQELEDASKSDVEKLTTDRDTHRTRADQAELELARLRVAIRKGLTEAQAKRLVGATEEDLEADADELLATFGTAAGNDDRPRERLGKPVGGADPGGDDEPVDIEAIATAARRRRY